MPGLGVSPARRVPALPALAVLLISLGLGACGGSGAEPVAPKTVVVTIPAGGGSAGAGMPGDAAATSASGGPSAGASSGTSSGTSSGEGTGSTGGGPIIDAGSKASAAFASPSGNIVCVLTKGETAAHDSVRCDVLAHTWTLPPKPVDCEFDWSHGVYLEGGSSSLTCSSDTVASEAAVDNTSTWWLGRPGSQRIAVDSRGALAALAYGSSLRLGTVTCLSDTDGVHCTDAKTGHGFDIAMATYRLN